MLLKIIVCILLCAVSISGTDHKILGGSRAKPGQFPYMLALESDEQGGHICGASAIDKDWALTAAHCIHKNDIEDYSIRAGSIQRNYGGTVHAIKQIFIHPEFNATTYENDIALIWVGKSFSYNQNVHSINLPEQDEQLHEGTKATVMGWGSISHVTFASRWLKYLELTITNFWKCKSHYQERANGPQVTDNNVCAAKEGFDSRRGDDGGPMVIGDEASTKIVGVVSWGDGEGYENKPGVYIIVSKYRHWIRRISGI